MKKNKYSFRGKLVNLPSGGLSPALARNIHHLEAPLKLPEISGGKTERLYGSENIGLPSIKKYASM